MVADRFRVPLRIVAAVSVVVRLLSSPPPAACGCWTPAAIFSVGVLMVVEDPLSVVVFAFEPPRRGLCLVP
jgi:hypothetical protein